VQVDIWHRSQYTPSSLFIQSAPLTTRARHSNAEFEKIATLGVAKRESEEMSQ